MKITLILITAIGSVLMAPIEDTKEIASKNTVLLHTLNSKGKNIWLGKTPPSCEKALVLTPKDTSSGKIDSQPACNEDLIKDTDDDQLARTFSLAQVGLPSASQDLPPNKSQPQELRSCEVPVSDKGMKKALDPFSEYKAACMNESNLRQKRYINWMDTAHAVSHYKVSEDYPELHQGNRHVISRDYPVPNLVRVTVREQF